MSMQFRELFWISKPIIGMIHLAGHNKRDKVRRALEEMIIYQEEGIDGVIIEDYHGDYHDVYETLKESSREKLKIIRGVNVLFNPYSAFRLASDFGAKFVQFDNVQTPDIDVRLYSQLREAYPDIAVLGGIGFKYTMSTGNPLAIDLAEGKSRCEAIVTTGSKTGTETPIEKLLIFRQHLGTFPLLVGAGVTVSNAHNQLMITDGAIVGSYFKPNGDTQLPVDRARVRDLMNIIKQIRRESVEKN
jgi:predicted TIM-barrel enzyme